MHSEKLVFRSVKNESGIEDRPLAKDEASVGKDEASLEREEGSVGREEGSVGKEEGYVGREEGSVGRWLKELPTLCEPECTNMLQSKVIMM